MKRVQDIEVNLCPSIHKSPKLDSSPFYQPPEEISNSDGDLSKLPNDEYQVMLGFLDPQDKKNLKLASRTCEYRVMTLDKSMRQWKIYFSDEDTKSNLDQVITLMKAKSRHILKGTFDLIQLSVDFGSSNDHTKLLLVDNVINHWNDTIHDLSIHISGNEFFLSNPCLRINNLQYLDITHDIFWNNNNNVPNGKDDFSMIASTFIERHSDNLEALQLNGPFEIEISADLKLKHFSVCSVSEKTVRSILKNSNHCLESFIWMNEFNYPSSLSFNFPGVLQEFSAVSIPSDQAVAQTLRCLSVNFLEFGISDESLAILAATSLQLEKFDWACSPYSILTTVLETSRTTLKELSVAACDTEISNIPDNLQLEVLRGFEVSGALMASLIISAKERIEKWLAKLKKLRCTRLSLTSLLFLTIPAGQTLQELEVSKITNNYAVTFDSLVNVKKLKCSNIHPDLASALITGVQSTLEHLELDNIEKLNFRRREPPHKLGLKRFVGSGIRSVDAITILNSSQLTLKEVKLVNIAGENTLNSSFNLRLNEFEACQISSSIVLTILQSLKTPLRKLGMFPYIDLN